MKVQSIQTKTITPADNIIDIVDQYIKNLEEKSIVALTSKIVAVTQKQLEPLQSNHKKLVQKEADQVLDCVKGVYLTVKNNIIVPNAGVDESNIEGFYVLWPKDIYPTCQKILDFLKAKFNRKEIGVIIVDSFITPLRVGTTGVGLGWAGFEAVKDYRGSKDLFGRELKITQANILDSLSTMAVFTMGEGAESTPLAVISRLTDNIIFHQKNITAEDVKNIQPKDDLFEKWYKK